MCLSPTPAMAAECGEACAGVAWRVCVCGLACGCFLRLGCVPLAGLVLPPQPSACALATDG